MLSHARALLRGVPSGATDYIDADVREQDEIVRAAAQTLDFNRPTALMLLGDTRPHRGPRRSRVDRGPLGRGAVRSSWQSRSPGSDCQDEIAAFLTGLNVLAPGVVPVSQWRPDPDAAADEPAGTAVYGGVARKA